MLSEAQSKALVALSLASAAVATAFLGNAAPATSPAPAGEDSEPEQEAPAPAAKRGRKPAAALAPEPEPEQETPAAESLADRIKKLREEIVNPLVDGGHGPALKKIVAKYSSTGLNDVKEKDFDALKKELQNLEASLI